MGTKRTHCACPCWWWQQFCMCFKSSTSLFI